MQRPSRDTRPSERRHVYSTSELPQSSIHRYCGSDSATGTSTIICVHQDDLEANLRTGWLIIRFRLKHFKWPDLQEVIRMSLIAENSERVDNTLRRRNQRPFNVRTLAQPPVGVEWT
jgi:hypothetical protein